MPDEAEGAQLQLEVPHEDAPARATTMHAPSALVRRGVWDIYPRARAVMGTHPSRPPETSCFMFGLKSTAVIASLCPRKERSSEGSTGEAADMVRGATVKTALRRVGERPKQRRVSE